MARNKAPSRVPSWFNLAAYDDLSVLDASGWLKVVEDLLDLLQYEIGDFVEGAGEAPPLGLLEEIFVDFQLGNSREGRDWRKAKYAFNPAAYEFGTTRSLTVGVVARMGATLQHLEGGRNFMGNMRLLVRREQEPEEDYSYLARRRALQRLVPFREFSDTPFFVALRDSSLRADAGEALTSNRAISVDMSAPDAIIFEDFKAWLREMRKLDHHPAARKKFSQSDFRKWSRNGYVPLLVLDKWRKISGAKLTLGDICDAAFPAGQRVEVDDLRKTLLPNALGWASLETAEALAAQAAHELGGGLSEESNP